MPFTLPTPKIKYLGINQAKYVQAQYKKNYKTLMKGIEEELNQRRNSPHSWIRRLNSVKISVIANLTYRCNVTPIKNPSKLFSGY